MSATHGRVPSHGRDAQAQFEEGQRLAARGQLDQAEAPLRRAAEQGHPTAAAQAGLFPESRGEMQEAEQLYRQADEGGDGYGAFRLGLLLSRRGDWDGATRAWRRAEERGYETPDFEAALVHGSADDPTPVTRRGAFANPVLLGAITTLMLLIAVFLAYNANSGLPFVPTRELKVDVPNGAALLPGNQVLAGGYDVGFVSDMRAVRAPNGSTEAQVILQLNTANGRVPVDSSATIAPRSLLGLKYVQLTYGHSRRVIPDG
ncbi:MAG TPA: MlaD family protein, partial [Solirubrobacteraceae bacterium]|nr:MlaD family protein [Solirubrobacteraceae bacterium]